MRVAGVAAEGLLAVLAAGLAAVMNATEEKNVAEQKLGGKHSRSLAS